MLEMSRDPRMLKIYTALSKNMLPVFNGVLERRQKRGKELPDRYQEKKGISSQKRPEGALLWLHAASVGEAQSALILLHKIKETYIDAAILVTTGTKTSAQFLEPRLPPNAIHQFCPLDYPEWTNRFLDHWKPDVVLWMESELWPNFLGQIKKRKIPAVLVNARMSARSFSRWKWFPKSIHSLLESFDLVLAQDAKAAEYFSRLGARDVRVGGNIKYSAAPLSCDMDDFVALKKAVGARPVWLYASTHDGEEAIACRVHKALKKYYPDILTILAPRHPERGQAVVGVCEKNGLDPVLRTNYKTLPDKDADVYVANTLGELGLFYSFSPIAMIGRSLSLDGGGGHNPIEAAQLGCAVITGAYVKNFESVFSDMLEADSALMVEHEDALIAVLQGLFDDDMMLKRLQKQGENFAQSSMGVAQNVFEMLQPCLSCLNASKSIEYDIAD